MLLLVLTDRISGGFDEKDMLVYVANNLYFTLWYSDLALTLFPALLRVNQENQRSFHQHQP